MRKQGTPVYDHELINRKLLTSTKLGTS